MEKLTLANTKNKLKLKTLITALFIVITTTLYSQNIEWETNLGGSAYGFATDIQQTSDSGYIVLGYTYSTDGDVGGNNGDNDYWVVKLGNTGNLIWETNIGGSGDDRATAIQQTTDDGYIVAGYTYSPDGDTDYWIVKLDVVGNLIWETNLGGSGWDEAFSIQQTSDGGYIIAGQSESNDGNVGGNNGQWDYWIVKIDDTGIIIWETNLGGSDADKALSIRQTIDDGFIIAGYSESDDGDVGENNGSQDYWIIKLDNSGNLIWETNLGGSSTDSPRSIQQTNDNGYIIAGSSNSSDGDVGGNNGQWDCWIVKLDNTGNLIWETNLGGSNSDNVSSIQQTIDGGYIIAGGSNSIDGDVGGNNGESDFWIVKLDYTGNIIWETNLGGSNSDYASSIQQTFDGGFIVAGTTYSSDGDVGGNNGNSDYWVVKLDGTLGIEDNIASKISLSPNPTTNTITIANLSQEISKIELLDMQGRLVLSQSEVIINNTLNISTLPSATYLVKIYVERTVFYKKVIKE